MRPRNVKFQNHNENADRHLIACALRWRPFYTPGDFTVTLKSNVLLSTSKTSTQVERKMRALRKPVLDARIFALQKETQKLELKIDRILIEKLYVKSNLIYLATRNFSFSYFIIRADFAKKQGRVWNVLGKI